MRSMNVGIRVPERMFWCVRFLFRCKNLHFHHFKPPSPGSYYSRANRKQPGRYGLQKIRSDWYPGESDIIRQARLMRPVYVTLRLPFEEAKKRCVSRPKYSPKSRGRTWERSPAFLIYILKLTWVSSTIGFTFSISLLVEKVDRRQRSISTVIKGFVPVVILCYDETVFSNIHNDFTGEIWLETENLIDSTSWSVKTSQQIALIVGIVLNYLIFHFVLLISIKTLLVKHIFDKPCEILSNINISLMSLAFWHFTVLETQDHMLFLR